LDLNATNEANNGNLGLALPRVELTSTTGFAPLKAHVAGMMVYNTTTNGEVTPGTYYNTGSGWVRIGSGSLISEGDGVIGNEVATATTDGGLTRAGSGTAPDPFTLGIETGGVTTARIADGAVTAAKLDKMDAVSGNVLKYNGSAWAPDTDAGLTAEKDGVIGNEVTKATAAGGLVRAGSGTVDDPYSLGIADAGVSTAKIADKAVTADKLAAMGATSMQVLSYNGSKWAPASLSAAATGGCVKSVQIKYATSAQWTANITHTSVTLAKSFVLVTAYDGHITITGRTATSVSVETSLKSCNLSVQIVEFY
jgi:hypothetical protein